MDILLEKSITLAHILCVRYSFWQFLTFEARFFIPVIPVKRPSQGCTLKFRPLSTRRWFKSRKFSRSAFFSAILNDLRSFHPGTCLNTKTPHAYRWNERFPPAFQVRFSLAMFLTIRLDTAAEETWVRGQFSPCRELYGRSMYNTYAILTETPNQR